MGMDYVVSIGDYDGAASFISDKIEPPNDYLRERSLSPAEYKRWRQERIAEEDAEVERRERAKMHAQSTES